jgi:uncharacterized membrane protein
MDDKEPQRYYDWILWKLRQDAEWNSIKEKTREPFIRQFLKMDSLFLALVYTLGHIVIAMNVIYWMTGASFWEAGAVALVEPAINGLWFFVLHILWKKIQKR